VLFGLTTTKLNKLYYYYYYYYYYTQNHLITVSPCSVMITWHIFRNFVVIGRQVFLESTCLHGMIESEIMRLADAQHAACSYTLQRKYKIQL